MENENGVWVVWKRGNYGSREIVSVHATELDALRELNKRQDYDAEGAVFLEYGERWDE